MFQGMNPALGTIRERLQIIADQRKALDAEEAELKIAERVISRLDGTRAGSVGVKTTPNIRVRPNIPSALTQAELIESVLRTSAEPWFATSTAVGEEIYRTHGVRINSNSLQPLLWTMKKQGLIVRDERNRLAWADRVKTREGALPFENA
jgi:hypothetical protein